MKKFILTLLCIAAVGALAWLIWFRPHKQEEEEKKPESEVPVHVAKIVRATLRDYVTAYGLVEPEPAGEHPAAGARLGPAVPGVVTVVKCAEGQRVEKGALLFQLDTRAADAAVEKAHRTVEFAEKNFERQKKLSQIEATSQKLLLDAEQTLSAARNDLAAAQAQQALLRIEAPLTGTVTRVNVKPGEAVDLTTTLGQVIDLDRLVVNAGVPSAELAKLKAGQRAEVLPEKSTNVVAGSLTVVGQEVDPKTGAGLVRAALPAGAGLRPGQFVAVRIVSEEHKDCLAVPAESVVKDAEGATVIAVVQGEKATLKSVKAGVRDAELVEIEGEGLQEGMTVVTQGAYALSKETKVRVLGKEGAEPKDKKTEKTETKP